MRLSFVLALLLLTSPLHADPRRDSDARTAFKAGAAAYEAGDYQTAYDRFKESFQLSHEPALLYNIASALQGLKRPHDAAEALRSFLRVQPNDPDRAKIEQRIATLEEEQRMIDVDRAKEPPPARAPEPTVAPTPTAHAAELTASAPPPGEPARKRRHTGVIVGVTIGAAVLVAGAITLGVLLSRPDVDPYTMGAIGPLPGTR
jgi:tetratricopeptide (TPR) repeat protein